MGARLFNALACAVLLAAAPVGAQVYPSKPVRLIVGFPPGGGVDINARLVASRLTERLRQQVIVDNRPGASGAIGAELAARARPDGHTLTIMSATTLTSTLLVKARYDTLKDFSPVTFISVNPYLLVVHPSVPATTVRELVTYAKANPGKLSYASSGNGGIVHLAAELLQSMTGTEMVHIPYKGMAIGYTDLSAGRIQAAMANVVSGMSFVKSGRVRALGVTSRTRMRLLPEMPTLNESGLPGYEVTQWNGLLGPAGLPSAIGQQLHRETAGILRQPDVIAHMAADGSEPVAGGASELAAHMQSEVRKWTKVIQQANIQPE